MKKLLVTCLLTSAILGCLLTGCGSKEESTVSNDGSQDINVDDSEKSNNVDESGDSGIKVISADTNLFSKDWRYDLNFTLTCSDDTYGIKMNTQSGENEFSQFMDMYDNKTCDCLEISSESDGEGNFSTAEMSISNKLGDVYNNYKLTEEQYNKIADLLEQNCDKMQLLDGSVEQNESYDLLKALYESKVTEDTTVNVHIDLIEVNHLSLNKDYSINRAERHQYFQYNIAEKQNDEVTDLIKEILSACSEAAGSDVTMETVK